jgi:hypothetical protein
MPEQLDVPPVPIEIKHCWDWWCKLNDTRQVSMDLCRISFVEIKAWKELYKIDISPFELDCITCIDSIYMRIRAEQQQRKQPSLQDT